MKSMTEDLQRLVKKNPGLALLGAVVLGPTGGRRVLGRPGSLAVYGSRCQLSIARRALCCREPNACADWAISGLWASARCGSAVVIRAEASLEPAVRAI